MVGIVVLTLALTKTWPFNTTIVSTPNTPSTSNTQNESDTPESTPITMSGFYNIKGGQFGKYCADEGNRIVCNRDAALDWEKFYLIQNGDSYNIKGGKDNKFCSDGGDGVACNTDNTDTWEQFKLIKL